MKFSFLFKIYKRIALTILFLLAMLVYVMPTMISADNTFIALLGFCLGFIIPPVIIYQVFRIIQQVKENSHEK